MASLARLPQHLLHGVKTLALALAPGPPYILMGGAAVAILGHKRGTRDLDVNIAVINKITIDRLQRNGIAVRRVAHVGRFSGNIASTPQIPKALSFDLAARPEIIQLMRFTVTVEGVVIAGHSLLIVDKIVTATERSTLNAAKIQSDLQDVYFCASELVQKGEKVSRAEILRSRLTEEVMSSFWKRLEDYGDLGDCEVYRDIFKEVGLL